MHRFIFIATFLPAVFLVDLLASSAFIQGEPAPIRFERAGDFSFAHGVSVAKGADSIPHIAPGPVKKEKVEFQCSDELYPFMLDHIRGLDGSEKAGTLAGADNGTG